MDSKVKDPIYIKNKKDLRISLVWKVHKLKLNITEGSLNFWPYGLHGLVLEKQLWVDYEQLLRSVFIGKKNVLKYFSVRSKMLYEIKVS